MDLVTHGLLGAVAVQATFRQRPNSPVSIGSAMVAGALAAAFPDIDYLLVWLDPLRFLADWHRGITHSLVMLPIFALLLGWLLATCRGHRQHWKIYSGACALGLLSHVLADLLTVYGTQLLAPLSEERFTLSLTYLVDPYFSAIPLLTWMLVMVRHRRSTPGHRYATATMRVARIGLMLLACYLALQAVLQHEARSLGDRYVIDHGLKDARVDALPQALSPFNWKLIVDTPDGYWVAHAHLQGPPLLSTRLPGPEWVRQLGRAYHAADALEWTKHLRPDHASQDDVVRAVWQHAALSRFRAFARYPVLARIDREPNRECAWFADLRYTVPALRPFFRYGMCRDGEAAPWAPYRIRRYTDSQLRAL